MSYQSLLFVLVGDVLFSFPLLAIHKQNLQWTWETPSREQQNRSSQGVLSHQCLRKASAADPEITGLGDPAGIAVES